MSESESDGSAGYSGTPLVRKLGLKSGMRVRILDAPAHYWEILGEAAETLEVIELRSEDDGEADFTHLFARRLPVLRELLADARTGMAGDGAVWVSWPKKASSVESEVGRSDVMREGKAVGLVDVKVCAVDETWSALKFVVPLELR